ncbi:DUF2029 domain-containing protein, partial [Paraburkholderia sp. EG285A]
ALAIKLQLAVLFSLALVCGRPWKMLLAASVFFSIFVLSSIAILVIETSSSFLSCLPELK